MRYVSRTDFTRCSWIARLSWCTPFTTSWHSETRKKSAGSALLKSVMFFVMIRTSYSAGIMLRWSMAQYGAPWCAIDHRNIIPAEYDVLIMTKNITDFSKADPADFFRVSECQDVVNGVHQLSLAIQEHLVKSVRDT